MRILIIGEYSALAKNLKNGFQSLGHEIIIISSGDGFKKIKIDENDIKYTQKFVKLFGKRIPKSGLFFNIMENISLKNKLKKIDDNFDLVVVVNYTFISNNIFQLGVSRNYITNILSNKGNLIMLCCGGDPATRANYYNGNLKYTKEIYPNGVHSRLVKSDKRFDYLIEESSVIIPTSYTYFDSIFRYCNNKTKKISNIIPVPITIGKASFSSCINRKIVIFHGLIREQHKGTKYFVEALEKIKASFSEKVEIVIDGKMPYDKYINLLEKVDVLLDQTNGYGISMNAALGLMKGKVVLGGNEKENEDNMNLGKVPIINVIPDGNYIYKILKDLILNPHKIDTIKKESRRFAEENLDAKIVAQRYLDFTEW